MITWIEAKTGGRGSVTEYISVSVNKNGTVENGNPEARSLCIRFSELAAGDLRLVAGDRVNIGFDAVHGQVVFKRTNVGLGSYKLACPKGGTVLTVQASSKLPWHAAISVLKKDTHIEGGHVALDAPSLFM
jgi:hypothetical protein